MPSFPIDQNDNKTYLDLMMVNGLVPVTPSDTVSLPSVARGFWVGGAGTISLLMWDGSTATLSGVPAGTEFPNHRVRRVNATGTTATLIVAYL